jgi:HD-GYP domain-containing protein (c-di-GMP phosphodiesterase class II)
VTLESERPEAYEPRDVELVEAMANQVGRSLRVSALLGDLAAHVRHGHHSALAEQADLHGRAVAELATVVGERLGMRPGELAHLRQAALFHELGTVCAPAAVVDKAGHLTDEEFAVLRDHPSVGGRLLHSHAGLKGAAGIVRCQRERYDGRGYPQGLAGDEIPLPSRILHACDAFVAMTTERPYRPALDRADAIEELRRGAGSQFDPEVVDVIVGSLEPRRSAISSPP